MIRFMEYNISFPRLYQLRDTQKIVVENSDASAVADALGVTYSKDDYEPVCLSFWWIKVFGFELVPNEALEEYSLRHADGRAYLIYRDSKGEWFCMNQKGYTRIKFVHELQEAYLSFLGANEAVCC